MARRSRTQVALQKAKDQIQAQATTLGAKEHDLESLRNQLTGARDHIADLRERNREAHTAYETANDQASEMEETAEKLRGEMANLNAQLAEKQSQVDYNRGLADGRNAVSELFRPLIIAIAGPIAGKNRDGRHRSDPRTGMPESLLGALLMMGGE